MAQIPSTPKPTTTTTSSRDAAKARAHAPSGKPAPSSPKKTPPATPKKKVDDGPLPEARKAAVEGASEVKKAMDAQPTPERAIIAGGIKAGEEGIKVIRAGVDEIGTKIKDATKPIHEPFTREIKEARKEISEAGVEYGKGWFDSLNPFDEANVRKAWEDAPTTERAIVFAGWEALKNVGSDTWNNVKNLGNLGKEVLEGVGEIYLHNPVFNAVREGGKGALELGGKAIDAAGSWFSDRISGGAEGAVKASKTASDTRDRIDRRSELQNAENARELREAADKFGDNFDGYSEIGEAWNSQPTIERQIVVAGYEAVENTLQGIGNTINDADNYLAELAEAGRENFTTNLENAGDAISGGAKAVGDFVGGLFG